MWPETETAQKENRHELVLNGKKISERIEKEGFDNKIFCLSSLNYLNISETSLTLLSDDIAKLSNLQTLVLHSNKLDELNENIANLAKLKVLDLSRNEIKKIPNIFDKLKQIVTINLSNNLIEDIEHCKFSEKLTVLDLSNNSLKQFPQIGEDLVALSELKLKGNQIESIPADIYKLSSLKLLDIGDNKIKTVPGELSDCSKLKELNLKNNPISDRRLLKLIDQCRTKQVLDYVKQNCPKTVSVERVKPKQNKKGSEPCPEPIEPKYKLKVEKPSETFKIVVEESVKQIRDYIVCCIVRNVNFDESNFKKFIQIQNKLHDTVCDKRNSATIATHDLKKIPPGTLRYKTMLPDELKIKPLNRSEVTTGQVLFKQLQTEANNLRKEKKRNTYSGIHKYLYLLEGKKYYPCLLDSLGEVISFPPLTNSDISKICLETTEMLVEVTSSLGLQVCKNVQESLIKEMVLLFGDELVLTPVNVYDEADNFKLVFPGRQDLKLEAVAVSRE